MTCAVLAVRCGSSTTTPTPPVPAAPVSSFITGLSSGVGGVATQQPGQLPTPSGGPSTGVSGNSNVIAGGSNVAVITSATPFQTVDLSVASGVQSTALVVRRDRSGFVGVEAVAQSVDGFWQLRLPAPVTSVQIVYTLSTTLPIADNGQLTSIFEVVSPTGAVGPPTPQVLTKLKAATGALQFSVSWDTPSDVDLHVVEPSGEEVFYANPSSRTGGQLDLDSNAGCSIDNKNNENIRWTTAPAGNYIVRVDYWSSCNVQLTNFAVTVNNGGSSSLFTGNFTGPGDRGAQGAGRTITTITRAASVNAIEDLTRLPALFTPSPLKLLQSAPGR